MTVTTIDPEFGKTLSPTIVRFERLLPGPIERVWAYLTEADKLATWLGRGAIGPQVGSEFTLRFSNRELVSEPVPEQYAGHARVHAGTHKVLRFEPPHALAFTWSDADTPSEVLFELAPEGDRVRLTVTHTRLTPSEKIGVSGGWHVHLDLLASRLAGEPASPFWSRLAEVDAIYRRSGAAS